VNDPVLVINMGHPWIECHRCGKPAPHRWGLPVDCETGNIVPTWFEGDWGGIPACEECYLWHQRWSERLVQPFDAPLV
jgi:hypothetical protein